MMVLVYNMLASQKKELVQAIILERLMITIVLNIELHLPAFYYDVVIAPKACAT